MIPHIRSDFVPVDPSVVPFVVWSITTGQYFQVAIVTVLVYDTLTTMDKEVRYFWTSSRSLVNIIYFSNRYVGILGALLNLYWSTFGLSLRLCLFANWTKSIAGWLTILLVDYILMARVVALSSHDKKVYIFLKTMFIVDVVCKLAIAIYITLYLETSTTLLTADLSVCNDIRDVPFFLGVVDWIIPMVYGLILMAAALYYAAEYWKLSSGLKGFPLVKVLITDQFIYYIFAVSCSILNIVDFRLAEESTFLSILTASLGNPSLLSILGCRLLVNLKEAGELGVNEGTSYRSTSVSAMEFS